MVRYILAVCFVCLLAACSGTDAPVDTKGVHLSMTSVHQTGNVVGFQLLVQKDGAPLPKARLTERYYPKHLTDTLALRSDSVGSFNFLKVLDDSVTQIAFQAISDSGVSNYVTWP